MSAIYLELDGQPVSLAELSWYEVAPCGCACGVMSPSAGCDDPITSPERCWAHFFDTKAEREKYQRLGFRFVLGRRSEVADRLIAPGECPHTPTYGYEKRPEPEGFKWACANGWGTSGNARLHLFHDEHVDRDRDAEWRDGFPKREAMCGASTTSPSARWHHTQGRVECSRCLKLGGAS